ncbi:MAG: hypothetical protein LDL51_11010, partial [Chloroflexi bacterium]|nr:hypothetical protein [Chloroflexota bacterium]
MLRRFSTNFALFSMALDGFSVLSSLWLAELFRPALSGLDWVAPLPAGNLIPAPLYALFPLVWILIYSALSIYDGRKFLRAMDEFSMLSLAMLIASVSAAGILYFSYRDVSRALFLVFIFLTYLICLVWRILARIYFRAQAKSPSLARRVLIVGAGALGQKVGAQLRQSVQPSLILVGYVDEPFETWQDAVPLLGGAEEIRDLLSRHQVTDVVLALPYSAYHQMGDIVKRMEDLPVRVWVALGFFDLAL